MFQSLESLRLQGKKGPFGEENEMGRWSLRCSMVPPTRTERGGEPRVFFSKLGKIVGERGEGRLD